MSVSELPRQARALWLSLDIFRGNARELKQLLILEKIPVEEREEWVRRGGREWTDYMIEVSRCIHNLVASNYSLGEHSKIAYEKQYKGRAGFNDRKWGEEPVTVFIKGLRNYCQHYNPAPLSIITKVEALFNFDVIAEQVKLGKTEFYVSTLDIDKSVPLMAGEGITQQGFSYSIGLHKPRLLEFGNWQKAAKDYIEDASDDMGIIDLLPLIDEYVSIVEGFYLWLAEKIENEPK